MIHSLPSLAAATSVIPAFEMWVETSFVRGAAVAGAGIEAAAALLAERPFALVFVTAHSDLKTRARMQALHPVGILPKPFTECQLLQIIHANIASPAA